MLLFKSCSERTCLLKFTHWKRNSRCTPRHTYTLSILVTDSPLWWKLNSYELLTAIETTLCALAFEFRSHLAISSDAFSIPLRSQKPSWNIVIMRWLCQPLWFYIPYMSSISQWKTLYELGFIFFLYRPVIFATLGPYKQDTFTPVEKETASTETQWCIIVYTCHISLYLKLNHKEMLL